MKISKGCITALLALSLSACASYYPVAVDVAPTVDARAGVYRSLPITLSSQDTRQNDYIIQVEQNNKKTVVIGASNNIKVQMQQALAEGFSTQGALIENDAPVQIELELQDVLARVIRGHISYDVVQQLRMQLTLKRDGSTITKQFRRSAQAEFPGRLHPELDKVTAALNEQLSLMVKDMLADTDVQQFVGSQS
ncbi:YajG family lipoprotein [Oceanisphaera pacifica]|uniref:YajG family lipoprotein n=1 Tax=Oceanisphaera pacifica TaxID=2818389 RepID=A0ABS3ND37_9GAMM|nr:YajG family lipoprotein [Oceanisphaera pacifica]MBO1518455.1 YajG family lipoprotein [Oceanisphaera pacifica]